jgi:hypothetical protein
VPGREREERGTTMPTITKTVLVSVVNGNIYADDLQVDDVGTGNKVIITWEGDGVLLEGIEGLPSNVRITAPDPFNHITGTYFSPTSEDTWDYTIVGTVEGYRQRHDPKIHNTTPT